MNSTINQLYRFSAAIKKPHSSQEKARIQRFIEKDELNEESKDFEAFVAWKMETMFPGTEKFLLDRLLNTITYRQKRLLYRQRHHVKLGSGVDELFNTSEPSMIAPDIPDRSVTAPQAIVHSSNPIQHPKATPSRILSMTNASSVDYIHASSYPKSIATSQLTTSAILERADFDVPRPPTVPQGANEVECPYCFRFLKRSGLVSVRWT